MTGRDDSPATTPICDVIWFELYVDDIDRAIDFYQRVFGWVPQPFLEHDPSGGYVMVSYAQDAPTQGALVRRTGPPPDPPGVRTCVIYVQVPNLYAAIATAIDAGGRLIEDRRPVGSTPGGGFFCTVEDTEANLIGLWASD